MEYDESQREADEAALRRVVRDALDADGVNLDFLVSATESAEDNVAVGAPESDALFRFVERSKASISGLSSARKEYNMRKVVDRRQFDDNTNEDDWDNDGW